MMAEVELDGVVQADETYFTVSYKGHHKSFKLPRPAHKRGTRATKRGLYREQVCVPCSVNLNGLSIAKVSNLGEPSLKDLTKVFGNKIAKDSVFVTDSLRPYQKLSLDMSLSHIRIPRGKRAVGTFNIQTINSYHNRLKNMLVHRFKGVATKYLNNYLVYHNFVNFAKDSLENKKVVLLDFIRNTLCSIKSKEVSRLPAIPNNDPRTHAGRSCDRSCPRLRQWLEAEAHRGPYPRGQRDGFSAEAPHRTHRRVVRCLANHNLQDSSY